MAQENVEKVEAQKTSAAAPSRSIWSGSITIGLVNVPVKLYSMVYDKAVAFHFLHKTDGQPVKYVKMCSKEDKVVPWNEVVRVMKSLRMSTLCLRRVSLMLLSLIRISVYG